MIVLDGRKVRDFHQIKLKERVEAMSFVPTLALIQVGDNKASAVYIGRKIALANAIGVKVLHIKFTDKVSFEEIAETVREKNADRSVHGVIIQLPLPPHLDKEALIDLIDPEKDVDGLASESQRLLSLGTPNMIPATAKAVTAILDFYKIEVRGKRVAVLGRSKLVGSPTAKLLTLRGAEVTVCHSKTPDTKNITRKSDIVVAAVGKPELIDASYVKKGVIIVDVGISSVGSGDRERLVGDVDQKSVAGLASAMTPVPGGVGPVTVACLFDNLIGSAEKISAN